MCAMQLEITELRSNIGRILTGLRYIVDTNGNRVAVGTFYDGGNLTGEEKRSIDYDATVRAQEILEVADSSLLRVVTAIKSDMSDDLIYRDCILYATNIAASELQRVFARTDRVGLRSQFIDYLIECGTFVDSEWDQSAPGDFVVYRDNLGHFQHIGRIIDDRRVRSKWGKLFGYVWEHTVDAVPFQYGTLVRVYKCDPTVRLLEMVLPDHVESLSIIQQLFEARQPGSSSFTPARMETAAGNMPWPP